MSSIVETPKFKLYETVFVLTPVLTSEQTIDIVQKFKNLLFKLGAEVVHAEEIGLKKLAYPIQHKATGFYQLVEFRAMPSVLMELERAYRQEEAVMRFLTCELNKYAVAYNEKQRTQAQNSRPNSPLVDNEVDSAVDIASTFESSKHI